MTQGSQPAGNTTTTQTPPAYMYPYIGTALGQGGNLLQGQQPQYYSGQQVAGFNPAQEKAMQATTNLGLNGTPGLDAAQKFDTTLMQGNGNPYETGMFNQAAQATQNQLASEFAGSGRGVTASMPLRSQQLNNLATDFYGNNYQNTMQNGLQAGNQAQGLYDTQLAGANAAMGVGNQVQQQSQNDINANMAKYNYYQTLPQNMLSRYEQNLAGVQPGSATSNPYFTNPTANALGAGLAASSIYNNMGQSGSKGGG
jgi:paraquat-inducible protein B